MGIKLSQPAFAALVTALSIASAIGTAAADDASPRTAFHDPVYLDSAALERLRTTNPDHYARARRILAAANHLCRPRLPETTLVQFRMQDFSCAPELLLTSLPPQRDIHFRLDETSYTARVFVTDDAPRAIPAR